MTRYTSRFQAGELLAHYIQEKDSALYATIQNNPEKCFCFAIPNGGVPVAEGFCSTTEIDYDIIIVRKVKIPYNPEAGFGSVTPDGTILINKPLLDNLRLSEKQKNEAIKKTKQEIQARLETYNKSVEPKEEYRDEIEGKIVFLLDDGLASGFTMLAAIKMVENYNPQKIYVAVPTAPHRTVNKVETRTNATVYSPDIKKVMRFAVANAYENWYDVPESEVKDILTHSRYYRSRIE